MADIPGAYASSYVEPRGTVRATIASAIGGAAGAMLAGRTIETSCPLPPGQIGFVALMPDQVVLFRGKRGAMKPKVTTEVLAAVPASMAAWASLERHGLSGALEIGFNDATSWQFDVPGNSMGAAQQVVNVISPPG